MSVVHTHHWSKKTQIALEYAYKCQDNGLDVFWLNCSTPQSLFAAFNHIQRMIQAVKKNDYDDDRTAVHQWLKHHKNWLLIFDNADDSSFPYGDWIPRYNGNASTRRILFTTRDERLSGAMINSVKAEVPLMDDHEATDLFNAGTAGISEKSTRSYESVLGLVQRLANLPLAVALAAACLREYPWVTVE
ncbi:hypothetical protein QQS21_010091 [Conoideocrella luteorostrata]|uniref:NB-ARC domain-containing protein n=1 Tax=Conoideocrella luteorostrata TaxID=1105319 RepID=A0AAJ0CI27_9HYPO|nr:hypothetical protein QQS21_010091 [Conoideocrella luteorostrata]